MPHKISHKKPVTTVIPLEATTDFSPQFNNTKFNSRVSGRGYNVEIEKAMQCPCADKVTGQGLPNCSNCGSVGWIFVDKRKTRAMIQSMNRATKYQKWTEADRGTASISVRGIDQLAFMDRVVNLDLLSLYSEKVSIKEYKTKLFGFTIYYPLEILEAYLFSSSEKPLEILKQGTDFTITENKIFLDNIWKKINKKELSISIRYKHNPVFHIIDIPREQVKVRKKDCETDGEDTLKDMPIHAVGKRAHLLLDAPNFDGESVFDNSKESVVNECSEYFVDGYLGDENYFVEC